MSIEEIKAEDQAPKSPYAGKPDADGQAMPDDVIRFALLEPSPIEDRLIGFKIGVVPVPPLEQVSRLKAHGPGYAYYSPSQRMFYADESLKRWVDAREELAGIVRVAAENNDTCLESTTRTHLLAVAAWSFVLQCRRPLRASTTRCDAKEIEERKIEGEDPPLLSEENQATHKIQFNLGRDMFVHAQELKAAYPQEKVGVLNAMGLSRVASGTGTNGPSTQEEQLCRLGLLAPLVQHAIEDAIQQGKIRDFAFDMRYPTPLTQTQAIVTEEVPLVLKMERLHGFSYAGEHRWKVAYHAVPAGSEITIGVVGNQGVSLPKAETRTDKARRQATLKAEEKIKDAIRAHVEGMYRAGFTIVVLTAFSCGDFRNAPEIVGGWYAEVLHEGGYDKIFQQIHFDVMEDNFESFKKGFIARYNALKLAQQPEQAMHHEGKITMQDEDRAHAGNDTELEGEEFVPPPVDMGLEGYQALAHALFPPGTAFEFPPKDIEKGGMEERGFPSSIDQVEEKTLLPEPGLEPSPRRAPEPELKPPAGSVDEKESPSQAEEPQKPPHSSGVPGGYQFLAFLAMLAGMSFIILAALPEKALLHTAFAWAIPIAPLLFWGGLTLLAVTGSLYRLHQVLTRPNPYLDSLAYRWNQLGWETRAAAVAITLGVFAVLVAVVGPIFFPNVARFMAGALFKGTFLSMQVGTAFIAIGAVVTGLAAGIHIARLIHRPALDQEQKSYTSKRLTEFGLGYFRYQVGMAGFLRFAGAIIFGIVIPIVLLLLAYKLSAFHSTLAGPAVFLGMSGITLFTGSVLMVAGIILLAYFRDILAQQPVEDSLQEQSKQPKSVADELKNGDERNGQNNDVDLAVGTLLGSEQAPPTGPALQAANAHIAETDRILTALMEQMDCRSEKAIKASLPVPSQGGDLQEKIAQRRDRLNVMLEQIQRKAEEQLTGRSFENYMELEEEVAVLRYNAQRLAVGEYANQLQAWQAELTAIEQELPLAQINALIEITTIQPLTGLDADPAIAAVQVRVLARQIQQHWEISQQKCQGNRQMASEKLRDLINDRMGGALMADTDAQLDLLQAAMPEGVQWRRATGREHPQCSRLNALIEALREVRRDEMGLISEKQQLLDRVAAIRAVGLSQQEENELSAIEAALQLKAQAEYIAMRQAAEQIRILNPNEATPDRINSLVEQVGWLQQEINRLRPAMAVEDENSLAALDTLEAKALKLQDRSARDRASAAALREGSVGSFSRSSTRLAERDSRDNSKLDRTKLD